SCGFSAKNSSGSLWQSSSVPTAACGSIFVLPPSGSLCGSAPSPAPARFAIRPGRAHWAVALLLGGIGLRAAGDDGFAWRRPRGAIEDAVPTDVTVVLEYRPGERARLGEIIGEVGVSIRGLAAFTGEGKGVVHLLLDVEGVGRCREALEPAGM